jgi:hypothetical protein
MRRFSRLFQVAGAVAAVTIGGVVGILWFASSITPPEPEVVTVEVSPTRIPTVSPPPPAPRPVAVTAVVTDSTDDLFRSLVAGLSSHPKLTAWLVTDGIVRRFVAAAESVAGGYSPRDELDFMRPTHPFLVRSDQAGTLVISSGSFRRYDLAADVVESIDSEGAVRLFRELEPLLDEAHHGISWGESNFEHSLRRAFTHLLDVPIPSGQLAVERRMLTYAYTNPAFEGLSHAQRQLLRMGPENAQKVQAKLRELADAFGWIEGPSDLDGPVVPAELEISDDPGLPDTAIVHGEPNPGDGSLSHNSTVSTETIDLVRIPITPFAMWQPDAPASIETSGEGRAAE